LLKKTKCEACEEKHKGFVSPRLCFSFAKIKEILKLEKDDHEKFRKLILPQTNGYHSTTAASSTFQYPIIILFKKFPCEK
jgi:hypothetical protein